MTSRLNKKAGMELSMNTIVILIVSIVTLGFAITLALNLFGAGQDKANLAFEDYERQKFDIACAGQKVCIETSQTVEVGDIAIFRLTINNVFDSTYKFKINHILQTCPGTGSCQTGVADKITHDTNTLSITSGSSADKVILIDTTNYSPGQYQIEVEVKSGTSTPTTEYFKKFIYLYVK